ncbi:MAG: hypothetical protein LBG45_03730 [Dysgonamonadaceae bacterium]|nr:hypothetical protein [Dysgonamonadaceae bacterium]
MTNYVTVCYSYMENIDCAIIGRCLASPVMSNAVRHPPINHTTVISFCLILIISIRNDDYIKLT